VAAEAVGVAAVEAAEEAEVVAVAVETNDLRLTVETQVGAIHPKNGGL
jgi:hypothetical protein